MAEHSDPVHLAPHPSPPHRPFQSQPPRPLPQDAALPPPPAPPPGSQPPPPPSSVDALSAPDGDAAADGSGNHDSGSRSPDAAAQRGVVRRRERDPPARPKNLQACDRCRTKKIKCVPIDQARRDICQSCHGAKLQCTFDLPLTASRTKRVRRGLGRELGAGPAGSAGASGSGSAAHAANYYDEREERDESDEEVSLESPERRRRPSSIGRSPRTHATPRPTAPPLPNLHQADIHREGPSAIAYVVHAMPTVPLRALDEYDRVSGYMMCAQQDGSGDGWMDVNGPGISPPPVTVLEALRSDSWGEVASRLVERFLAQVSPLVPVVVRTEVGTASESLLHAMAAVMAARSNVPPVIFEALRHMCQRELEENDTMSVPTRENVQVLLALALVDELAMRPGPTAAAHISRGRLAAAIRLAKDLGLNRAANGVDARLWRCARVIDVWHAAKSGCPPVVEQLSSTPIPGGDEFFTQLYALSMILARMLSTMYGPDGLRYTSNETLLAIRNDMSAWQDSLPPSLKATGPWPGQEAGLLQLLYSGMRFLLYRPVMRFSFIVPQRFELDCDIPAWMEMLALSRGAIDWAVNQDEVADLLFMGPYALCLSCLVQYHTWARRGEWDGAVLVEKARRDGVARWLSRLPEGHHPLLRRQLSVIDLLHTITQTHREASAFDGPRGLNPTPGVLNRLSQTSIAGVTWLRDESLPHGGVLVATQKAAREVKDLPPGTVIIGGPPEDMHPVGAVGGGADAGLLDGARGGSSGGGGGGGASPPGPPMHQPGAVPAGPSQFAPSATGYLSGLLGTATDGVPVGRPPQWDAVASLMFPMEDQTHT